MHTLHFFSKSYFWNFFTGFQKKRMFKIGKTLNTNCLLCCRVVKKAQNLKLFLLEAAG